MKRLISVMGVSAWLVVIVSISAQAQELMGGQVFFKGGYSHLDEPRTGAAFIGAERGQQDAWQVGAGLDLPLMKVLDNTLLGEVMVEYSEVANKRPTFLVTGAKAIENLLHVVVAPKLRIDALGSIRPWILPIGLSFNVNSPPTEGATYLSVGGTTGAGIEYVLMKRFSVGVDLRYYFGEDVAGTSTNHLSTGGYIGINF